MCIRDRFLGTWLLSSASINGSAEDAKDINLSYTFNDDGVVLQNADGTITNGTYEVTENNLAKMTFPGGEFEAALTNGNLKISHELSGSTVIYTFSKQ